MSDYYGGIDLDYGGGSDGVSPEVIRSDAGAKRVVLYDATGLPIDNQTPLLVRRRSATTTIIENAVDASAWGITLQTHLVSEADLEGARAFHIEINFGNPGPDQPFRLLLRKTSSFGTFYDNTAFLPAGNNRYGMVHEQAADGSSSWNTWAQLGFAAGPLSPFVIRYGFAIAITSGSTLNLTFFLHY